jgi:hypothetical protein
MIVIVNVAVAVAGPQTAELRVEPWDPVLRWGERGTPRWFGHGHGHVHDHDLGPGMGKAHDPER